MLCPRAIAAVPRSSERGWQGVSHLDASLHVARACQGQSAPCLRCLDCDFKQSFWEVGGGDGLYHHFQSCSHKEQSVEWANWPLPVTQSGDLADIGIYARDVIRFASVFVEIAGLRRAEPRALPGQAHASQLRSLEERTRGWRKKLVLVFFLCKCWLLLLLKHVRNWNLLEKSFFRERFDKTNVDLFQLCGCRLAVQHTMLV